MENLFRYRRERPEPGGPESPQGSEALDELRARGEVMLNTSSRAIARVMDPERFLTQARQRSAQ